MDFAAARRVMIDGQIRPNDVTDPELIGAIMRVAREAYVPASRRAVAYGELEIETSEGRAMWTPRDFSRVLKAVAPTETDIALVIGAGAGYETSVLSYLVETAIGLEEDEGVVAATTERLAGQGVDRAVIVAGPLVDGLADQGPFDVIIVNGMVETVPDAWIDQLADNGRLGVVVETGDGLGVGRVYTRSGETVSWRSVFEAWPPKFEEFNKRSAFAF